MTIIEITDVRGTNTCLDRALQRVREEGSVEIRNITPTLFFKWKEAYSDDFDTIFNLKLLNHFEWTYYFRDNKNNYKVIGDSFYGRITIIDLGEK